MKVYLDEDLSPAIGALLRQHGIDASTAHAKELGTITAHRTEGDTRTPNRYACDVDKLFVD